MTERYWTEDFENNARKFVVRSGDKVVERYLYNRDIVNLRTRDAVMDVMVKLEREAEEEMKQLQK